MSNKWVRTDPEEIVQSDIVPGNLLVIEMTEEGGDFMLPTPTDDSVPRFIIAIAKCGSETFKINDIDIEAETGKIFAWCTEAWTAPI